MFDLNNILGKYIMDYAGCPNNPFRMFMKEWMVFSKTLKLVYQLHIKKRLVF